MSELLLVLFVLLIGLGVRLLWLHDLSSKGFWHYTVWSVLGVLSVVAGVFGTVYCLGEIFGGVL